MKRVGCVLTEKQYSELEEMVKNGVYGSMSEAVRDAVRKMLEEKQKEKR